VAQQFGGIYIVNLNSKLTITIVDCKVMNILANDKGGFLYFEGRPGADEVTEMFNPDSITPRGIINGSIFPNQSSLTNLKVSLSIRHCTF
jgi:hypothetical protein